MKNIFDKALGTACGAGYWPWGPGTMGAAVGVLVWWLASLVLAWQTLFFVTLAAVVVVTLISVPSINRLEREWGPDPSRVVIDEVVGVWICLLAVPAPFVLDVLNTPAWWWILGAFVLFRFFDIVKPLGVRSMEKLPGGWGVMADDILAGIYGAAVMLIIAFVMNIS